MSRNPQVLVIGLDAAVPNFVFEKWKDLLPNLSYLIDNGVSGKLRSCFPPITVPAWMCMFTGKDPGELGIYGFRNRKDYNYNQLEITNSTTVKEKTIWDYCTDRNIPSIVVGVPPTYPPKQITGKMISCFLTPPNSNRGIFPYELWNEIMSITDNNYLFDVYDFRKLSKKTLLEKIYQMTEARFILANEWIKTKEWNLFILMEIGLDRLQHSFWAYQDPSHYLFEEGNNFINSIKDYYIFLDKKIGELIKNVAETASILVVSDHGAKTMAGGFCLNEWLIQNNYLKLKNYPLTLAVIELENIDWDNTVAWAEGGYYGRLFLNVKEREPNGIVNLQNYDHILFKISSELNKIKNINGFEIDIKSYYPQKLYKSLNGIPPDLVIVFNDFSVRSLGTVGMKKLFSRENDTGTDGANHDMEGIYILKSEKLQQKSARRDASIYEVFPTLIDLLDLDISEPLNGKNLIANSDLKEGSIN